MIVSDEKWICDFERKREETKIKKTDKKELVNRLKDLTKSLQEGSDKLYEISEAKAYNPRYYLAKAILDDMVVRYEELGGLLRAINAKKEEIF